MKRLAIIAAALMLTLGLAQCKKEQPAPQTTEGGTIHITVNVDTSAGSATKGSKADVTPGTGEVRFNSGDKLYVGYDGAYAGVLSYSESTSAFSGSITIGEPGQRLYFYYLGGMEATVVDGNYTVSISDQTSNYPVISCGYSAPYTVDVTAYSTILMNQCALVKFTTNSIPTSAAVTITGMNNEVTVDFGDNGFAYSKVGDGNISLHAVSETERWAILLPQAVVGEGVASTEYDGYTYIGTRPAIAGGIAANQYLDAGINMAVDFNQYVTPLTFEAKTAGATVYLSVNNGDFEFSTNGIEWEPYTSGDMKRLSNVGDKISFRGNSTRVGIFQCNSDNQCYIYGNVMSLVNKTDYATTTSLPSERIFQGLFQNNKAIYNHPLKTLALPATTLQNNCYKEMFIGCTNLTKAPDLPAENLAESCYNAMFYGCTNLTTAPARLPATILANSCYYQMFYGCSSLTAAPELPAPTLVSSCYGNMFYGCSSLRSVTCLATPNSSYTNNWMGGNVSSSSSCTFTKKTGTNWGKGSSGIPYGWTVVEVD